VLELIAAGLSEREIAAALTITPATVKTHVRNLLAKLGVHNRAHAVAVAIRLGMIG
jgi:two-component system, NarL family, response regulator